jgi:hypothetical protein
MLAAVKETLIPGKRENETTKTFRIIYKFLWRYNN